MKLGDQSDLEMSGLRIGEKGAESTVNRTDLFRGRWKPFPFSFSAHVAVDVEASGTVCTRCTRDHRYAPEDGIQRIVIDNLKLM